MGKIFKTPSDDSTEATLRAMHITNELDNYYERGWGWLRTILFTFSGIMIISAYEFHTEISVWEKTADWFINKIASWVEGLL